VKKKKFVRKGSLIAEIPSLNKRKRKSLRERLRDSQNSVNKKRPETTTSCGLEKSHPSRDSHQKGPRQQQVVA
jgi:hypothetical protein